VCVVHVGLQPHARAASAGRTVGGAAAKSASRKRHTPDEGHRGLSEAVLVVGVAAVVLVARSALVAGSSATSRR